MEDRIESRLSVAEESEKVNRTHQLRLTVAHLLRNEFLVPPDKRTGAERIIVVFLQVDGRSILS